MTASTLVLPDGGVGIVATGMALGEHVVTTEELAARHGWDAAAVARIRKGAGVEQRHHAAPTTTTADLGARAAADLTTPTPARLLLATVSPDTPVPSGAPRVAARLGWTDRAASDVGAACSGFLYGLDLAARHVLTGDPAVLLVAADVRSRFVPWDRPGTASLFGDGAGAALVAPTPAGTGLLACTLHADGRRADTVQIPAGGSREPTSPESARAGRHLLHMDEGPQLFLEAVEGMVDAGVACLALRNLTWEDVDIVVPHQPNARVVERIHRFARIPADRVFNNVRNRGNMGGATLAVALHEAIEQGRVRPGARVLLLAAGAGFTAGAAYLVWPGASAA